MNWKIISFSEVKVPAPPYKQGYILAIAENDEGKRVPVQLDLKFRNINIDVQGRVIERSSSNGKINFFIPNDFKEEKFSKVALITGSSRGIGKEIAFSLAEIGITVVINNSRNTREGQNVVEEIKRRGGTALYLPFQIKNESEVKEAVDKIVHKFGRIHFLINNAGITRDKKLENMSSEIWKEVIEVNLTGTFNCTRAVLPIMQENCGGCIVNISSIVGEIGNIGQSNYAASKGGIISFTKTIAREYAPEKIRVNAITPGFIDTDMLQEIPKGVIRKIIDNIPLGRLGRAEEVANVVKFLVSEESSYITGQIIGVNGGLLM